jgi:cytochrome c oxidase subunit 4
MAQHVEHAHEHQDHTALYAKILGVLLFLTLITVVVAKFFHFGDVDIIVAMLIASAKAALVGLYFMHLKFENPLVWVYVAFPIVLLFILIGGVLIDNPLRIIPEPLASPTAIERE